MKKFLADREMAQDLISEYPDIPVKSLALRMKRPTGAVNLAVSWLYKKDYIGRKRRGRVFYYFPRPHHTKSPQTKT